MAFYKNGKHENCFQQLLIKINKNGISSYFGGDAVFCYLIWKSNLCFMCRNILLKIQVVWRMKT